MRKTKFGGLCLPDSGDNLDNAVAEIIEKFELELKHLFRGMIHVRLQLCELLNGLRSEVSRVKMQF